MTNLSAKVLLEGNKLFTEFKGSLTEQFVCQQLISEFGIEPYYWSAKSLKQYREVYNPTTAFRFSLSDYENHGVLKDCPLYAIPMIRKFLQI